MANARIPDPLERRLLLQNELSAEQATQYAEAYLEEGRLVEAVDFFIKAEAEDQLNALADRAVAEGDAFLLRVLSQARRHEESSERWAELAEAAKAAGFDAYAETAARVAHLSEEE